MDETLLTPEGPAQSPFLSDTNIQFAWDSTSIGLLKTCPRLYEYTMIEGWQPKGESVHLRFGIEFHQAVSEYDIAIAEGANHAAALSTVVGDLMSRTADFRPDPETKAGKYKNRESLVRSVIYYLDERRTDTMKTVILNDGKPAVELSFRFELEFGPVASDISSWDKDPESQHLHSNSQPYLLCGHLDRVVSDSDDNLFIEDHKTTTSTPGPYYFNQYDPNNQMSLYSFAGRVVLGMPIRGVMVNAVQYLLTEPFNKFVRGFTFRNNDQLEEWLVDLSHWLQIAEWYATNGHWPMNDTACDKFGGCRFREICSKAANVRHIWLNSNFTKLPENERWNPLRSR